MAQPLKPAPDLRTSSRMTDRESGRADSGILKEKLSDAGDEYFEGYSPQRNRKKRHKRDHNQLPYSSEGYRKVDYSIHVGDDRVQIRCRGEILTFECRARDTLSFPQPL